MLQVIDTDAVVRSAHLLPIYGPATAQPLCCFQRAHTNHSLSITSCRNLNIAIITMPVTTAKISRYIGRPF